MKICVVTPRFAVAGVPLAQLRFAKALYKQGHSVDLVIGYVDPQYTPPVVEDIRLQVWDKPRVSSMLFDLVRYMKDEKPDIIFSAEDHLNIIVLIAAVLSFSNAKISGSSRILPTDRMAYSNKLFSKGWVLKQFMKSVMWRADALTCVSKDMVNYYKNIFKKSPHVSVYNIIKDAYSMNRINENVDHDWLVNKECPVVIAAGTMTKRKGFFDLINAFSLVTQKRFVRLIILGDGYLQDDLVSLVNKLGLSQNVSMPGNVSNALKYFAQSDVFVLSSYAEGMPNVLVEAMMCGCTPVSTDCPTGPRELLEGGKYGYLVPMHDPVALASGILTALDNPIASTMLKEAVAPFEENTVINRHFEVLGLMDQVRLGIES